jgi:hypothetical protein
LVNSQFGTAQPFDYTKVTKVEASNVLLKATDRIRAYYSPTTGMTSKNFPQLMNGVEYPGVLIKGPNFTANSFQVSSNILSFNYNGLTVTSTNIEQVDFLKLGFELDQSIKIDGQYSFDFKNNGFFKIVSVDRDSMILSGEVIETTYKMLLDTPVTVYAGNIITQANTLGNAYVLNDAINSRYIEIIHTTTGFRQTSSIPTDSEIFTVVSVGAPESIYINNVLAAANVQELYTGGNANVTISYLDLESSVLDSNIFSTYKDSSLGIRPEDINIVGGAYVDTYNSHAPEELIPGRIFDTLEMKVFSKNSSNTQTYGYRIFHPMNRNPEFTRISANNTVALSSNLELSDEYIFVNNIDNLPKPNPAAGVPGVVYVNGERIHYYQHYNDSDIAGAVLWNSATDYPIGTIIDVDIGVLYSNIESNVNGVNFDIKKYQSTYSAELGFNNVDVFVGNVFKISGNLLQGTDGVNDAIVTVNTDGLNIFYTTTGTSAGFLSTVYLTTGNVYANSNVYITTSNLSPIYSNSITQLTRAVDGTGATNTLLAGNLIVDSSKAQIIPDSHVFISNTISGNINSTSNVTYKLSLSSNITANIGDYITQFADTGNARILESVVSANVVAVDFVTGIFQLASNLGTRVNLVSLIDGVVSTTSNVTNFVPLGSVNANGNVVINSVTLLQSNIWTQLSGN